MRNTDYVEMGKKEWVFDIKGAFFSLLSHYYKNSLMIRQFYLHADLIKVGEKGAVTWNAKLFLLQVSFKTIALLERGINNSQENSLTRQQHVDILESYCNLPIQHATSCVKH